VVAPNIDSHMSRPGHVAFGLWQTGPLHPRPQTLAAVEGCWVGHHVPLESLVSESIADLDFHRQQGEGVTAIRRFPSGSPLLGPHALSLHSIT
jgi:hypothetical protein